MSALWSFLAGLFKGFMGLLAAYLAGELNQKKKQAETELEAIRDVKKIHDTIERNPSERKRVRDKYK